MLICMYLVYIFPRIAALPMEIAGVVHFFELCQLIIYHPLLEEGGAGGTPGADLHTAFVPA